MTQANREQMTLALIGAPTDVGASVRGANLGPEALRVAGIEAALAELGYRVHDRGNVAGPRNPQAAPQEGYRHLSEVSSWCRSARDAVAEALAADELPILLGGDHSLALGSIAAVRAHCDRAGRPLAVLWLDAHTDFNTPASSPSGNLHGMPLAALCGHGHLDLLALAGATSVVEPAQVALLGVRSIDAIEKQQVVASGLQVQDMRRIDEFGMRAAVAELLERVARPGVHLHVSFDLDFADPEIAPGVGTPVPGGPTYREAQLCMEMIHDSGLLGSLDVVETNPARDDRNRTAELAVELVQSLFGEQILARTR
jgi:arginase